MDASSLAFLPPSVAPSALGLGAVTHGSRQLSQAQVLASKPQTASSQTASSQTGASSRAALAVGACIGGFASTRIGRRRQWIRRRADNQRHAGLLVDLTPGWLSRGPGGDGATTFPFPHWIWQHGIARFEAAKLADPEAIHRRDLEAAWNLHYDNGYISHANIEDERVFPALLSLEGGKAAVDKLAAHHGELDALATEISHSLSSGVDDEEMRVLLGRWSTLLLEHMDLEESLIVPLVETMAPAARDELGAALKKGMRHVPGSKMILCLFRDISATDVAVAAQYGKSFPGFLRYILIPTFSRIDKQYAEHRRVFGKLAAESLSTA